MKRKFWKIFLGWGLIVLASPLIALKIPSQDIDRMRWYPETVLELFHARQYELGQELGEMGATLGDRELYLIFCGLVAHRLASYGGSRVTCLRDILFSRSLNCGNYGIATIRLAQVGWPGAFYENALHFVGWEGAPFGNHQTLFVVQDGVPKIFIDPTTGLVAFASFDDICSGKPVSSDRVFDFCEWYDIVTFKERVKGALLNGGCRPSHLLYYFYHIDGFIHHCTDCGGLLINPDTTLWMTPAGQRRVFP